MSVLLESFSVILSKEALQARYPGGVEGFISRCAARETLCEDQFLVRVAFCNPCAVQRFLRQLKRHGLKVLDERGEQGGEVAVIDFCTPFCLSFPEDGWLQVVHGAVGEDSYCYLAGTLPGELAVPDWRLRPRGSGPHQPLVFAATSQS
jgi:hypothetical protein